MKFLDGIKKALTPKPTGRISVGIVDKSMVYLAGDQEVNQFRLADVKEIFAFKRDLLTVDLICIGFRVDDSGGYFEIDEEMENYKDCLSALPKHFNSMNEEWFVDVAFPAFSTNCTTIWGDRLMPDLWKQA